MTAKINLSNNICTNIITCPYADNDFAFVEQLQAKAFGPGRFARAAFRVRERFLIDKNLSLIAKVKDKRVGFVGITPISINKINGYLLGPLVIDKKYRAMGIGRELVTKAIKNALEKAGEFVLLVGDLSYYESMGFVATNIGSIKFPAPVDPKRILVHCKNGGLIDRLYGELEAFI